MFDLNEISAGSGDPGGKGAKGVSQEKINKLDPVAFQILSSKAAPGRNLTREQFKVFIDSIRGNNSGFGLLKNINPGGI